MDLLGKHTSIPQELLIHIVKSIRLVSHMSFCTLPKMKPGSLVIKRLCFHADENLMIEAL